MLRIVDQASELIEDLAPELDTDLEVRSDYTIIRLPPAATADYSFQIYVHQDGEPQIGTELIEGGDFNAFWYWPFEIQDFSSQEAQGQAFLQSLHSIISFPTRILRRSGFLFYRFRCEAYEHPSWRQLGPVMSFFKRGHRAPPGRSFQSPPLAPSSRAA